MSDPLAVDRQLDVTGAGGIGEKVGAAKTGDEGDRFNGWSSMAISNLRLWRPKLRESESAGGRSFEIVSFL